MAKNRGKRNTQKALITKFALPRIYKNVNLLVEVAAVTIIIGVKLACQLVLVLGLW